MLGQHQLGNEDFAFGLGAASNAMTTLKLPATVPISIGTAKAHVLLDREVRRHQCHETADNRAEMITEIACGGAHLGREALGQVTGGNSLDCPTKDTLDLERASSKSKLLIPARCCPGTTAWAPTRCYDLWHPERQKNNGCGRSGLGV